ncbi:uncharacterized protein LOC101855837 [Aplysia californica]|uniref:Uncharacterized protein LOC101855837 n=1 Tax=Aplysia californica TaxID=6500 RepID=A0ABM1VSA6_APLCA|nr:uncharacterized protein LOC101855837 [Aplysia californica]
MSDPTNSEFKKRSARANSIEKRRLELEVSMFDKAKRTMAIDMRKAQSEYKHRLHLYRDRQKEIMMSRSSASPSTASMGEFLLQRLKSRRSASPLRKVVTPRGQSVEDINSWQKSLPKIQTTRRNSLKSLSDNSQDSSKGSEKGANCLSGPDSRSVKGRESPVDHVASAQRPPTRCCGNTNPPSEARRRSSTAPLRREASRPRTSSILKTRHLVSSLEGRPKTSGASVKILENSSSSSSQPANRCQSRKSLVLSDWDTSANQDATCDMDCVCLEDDSHSHDEFEAEEELGRISNRHRSKLDLRPSTAWSRLNGSTPELRQNSALESTQRNPFTGMTGHLGEPWRQVRYFDDDEIEERGLFYRLLLKDRLEREQTKFQDICAKVNAFCETPESPRETPRDTGSRRASKSQSTTLKQQTQQRSLVL